MVAKQSELLKRCREMSRSWAKQLRKQHLIPHHFPCTCKNQSKLAFSNKSRVGRAWTRWTIWLSSRRSKADSEDFWKPARKHLRYSVYSFLPTSFCTASLLTLVSPLVASLTRIPKSPAPFAGHYNSKWTIWQPWLSHHCVTPPCSTRSTAEKS